MHKIVLLIYGNLFCHFSNAQQLNRCFTHELMLEKEKQSSRLYAACGRSFQPSETICCREISTSCYWRYHLPRSLCISCIYTTPAENIDDSVIRNQIDVLNRDYRRRNADTVDTRPVFQDRAGDTRIEFFLGRY
jgi:hypothetical protein